LIADILIGMINNYKKKVGESSEVSLEEIRAVKYLFISYILLIENNY